MKTPEDGHLGPKHVVLKVKLEEKGTICCIIDGLLYIDVLAMMVFGCGHVKCSIPHKEDGLQLFMCFICGRRR
jgi:hypothetical protein